MTSQTTELSRSAKDGDVTATERPTPPEPNDALTNWLRMGAAPADEWERLCECNPAGIESMYR